MDDLSGTSFLDFVTGAHSTMPSGLEVNGTGLDTTIKQESFDSSVWIHGFSDTGFSQQNAFQSTKTTFLQSTSFSAPVGLESLISDTQTSSTPPGPPNALDPLELILNQPPVDSSQSSSFLATVQATTASGVKAEPPSDFVLTRFLEASTHNATQGSSFPATVKAEPPSDFVLTRFLEASTHNAIQGQILSETFTRDASEVKIESSEGQRILSDINLQEQIKEEPQVASPEPAVMVPEEINPEKDLNLLISNVVASFRVRCHLNLRRIAHEGINVIYQKESKKIVMRIRHPKCTAYVWSSGKIICTGANSESAAKKAARKFAKRLQNMGFQVTFSNFKVVNVLAVCKMPFHVDIVAFSESCRSKHLSYEPEIHPAVTYRMPEFKVTFKIFSTGSITLTCPVVSRIPEAIKKVYPLVKDFFKLDRPNDILAKQKASEQQLGNVGDRS